MFCVNLKSIQKKGNTRKAYETFICLLRRKMQWLVFLWRVWKPLGSNLGPHSSHHDWAYYFLFLWYRQLNSGWF
jgi:hypothetical protein